MEIRQCSQKWIPIVALIMLFLVTIACATSSNNPVPTLDSNLLQTAIAGTSAVAHVQTLTASVPINTQIPPNTPESTNTPEPTNTPLPPTVPPEHIILTGIGDSIVDINNPYEIAIVHITGNASSRFFAVKNYGSDGIPIDLLVNTTDPYDGVRPLDFGNGEHTTRFEVSASDEWRIEVLPVSSAPVLTVPGSIDGKNDEVILVKGAKPDLAKIKGNADSRFFAVKSYGHSSDLLVNTTDPYEGTVIVSDDMVIIEIQAIGTWSIEITAK
jgi:hypothetical protein